MAFSRILGDREVTVVANCSATQTFGGAVLLDRRVSGDGERRLQQPRNDGNLDDQLRSQRQILRTQQSHRLRTGRYRAR